MNRQEILNDLENLASDLSISVIYDRISGEGGYCFLNDKHYIIINNSLSTDRKIEILIEGISSFPLDNIYIKPRLRTIIKSGTLPQLKGRASS
ncbi:MAG TPA: hypothetical protein EYP24_05025 [bacterium (Candidatus Stahlbacteria)]|nr:hypothetical protein [Candidatus Stahlbacteria bacterium]